MTVNASASVARMRPCSLVTLCVLGCGSDPAAPSDAAVPDDVAPCTTPNVSGELVDWDSTTANFRGIPGAQLSVAGESPGPATPPNGRWELCATGDPIELVVEAPATYLDASVHVEAAALGGRALTLRSLTRERAETFYAERSLTFDPARAHVLVFLAGDRFDLSLDRTHDAVQAANDDSTPGTYVWSAGIAGRYVLFPNVAVDQPTGTLGGDPSGPHAVPLTAGKLTIAALLHVFI